MGTKTASLDWRTRPVLRGSCRLALFSVRDRFFDAKTATITFHCLVLLSTVVSAITKHIVSVTSRDEVKRALDTVALMRNDGSAIELVSDLIQAADLGIEDVRVPEGPGGGADDLAPILPRLLELADRLSGRNRYSRWLSGSLRRLRFYHRGVDGQVVPFRTSDESDGTLSWFALLGPMVRVLSEGGLLVVDELNAHLHELLQVELIQRFNNPDTNPGGGQLLFASQDSTLLGNVLGRPTLRRDQVWFTSKTRAGMSRLYPLTEFSVRKGEKIQRRYLEGRFGALPYLDDLQEIRIGTYYRRPGKGLD